MRFQSLSLDDLFIEDERSFRHVGFYEALKQALRLDGYRFRVPEGDGASWDRVLFLNLTYWDADEQGDVLASSSIPADVICHVAWHHLARKALARAGAGASADALYFGEAIASAFDLYLAGRLVGHAAESEFLESQVPAMREAAAAAGLSDEGFEALMRGVNDDPERAFEDLRALLFDACTSLVACRGVDEAVATLDGLSGRRFAPLLHHFEISNWVLYARAHGASLAPDPAVRALDAELRAAPVSLEWLERQWLSARAEAR